MSILPPSKRKGSKKRGKGNAGGPAFPTERNEESKNNEHQPNKRSQRNKKGDQQGKTRRGKPRQNALKKFKILLNNIRGLKTKQVMMNRIVLEENPVIFACVETKLNEDDKVTIPGYKISRVDRVADGGGVLLAYRQCLQKILVETKEIRIHDAEMLWKKLDNGKVKMVIGVIYMPQ